MKYCYFLYARSNKNFTFNHIETLDHEFSATDIREWEKYLETNYPESGKWIIASITLISKTNENSDETNPYVVHNISRNEKTYFPFRSDAEDYFDHLKDELGSGCEIEMCMIIKKHVPPERV